MKKALVLIILITSPISFLFAQEDIQVNAKLETGGFLSSKEELPFWLYSNQYGRIDEETDLYALLDTSLDLEIYQEIRMEAAASFLYRKSENDKFYPEELYVKGYGKWLEFIVGKKNDEIEYDGLSATNGHILNSNNSRPFPGLQLNTVSPIYFDSDQHFGFEMSWAEFLLDDDREVEETRLHHKSLHFVYQPSGRLNFKLGIEHYAQWAGTSETDGKLPDGFDNYLRILYAGKAKGDAPEVEKLVALGNHLGSYQLEAKYEDDRLLFNIFLNTIFEDPKGSTFKNFPDGYYGAFLKLKDEKYWVRSFLYEFYYTRDQSRDADPFNSSDYFNNPIYTSGWAYHDRVIGAPFFDYDKDANKVTGNKFVAHHVGFKGDFLSYGDRFPFRLMGSLIRKEGTYDRKYFPNKNEYYLNYEIGMLTDIVDIQLLVSTEFSSVSEPIYGGALKLSRTIF
ncbi:MAG: capsule assembly Wzi family protein [Christiangramia sp.]|nr:capsule assembly Wzi family protein [Christiangramia sp.]